MKSLLILFISLPFVLATNTNSADSEISWFIPRHLFCPKEIESCGICHKVMEKDQVTVSYHTTEIHRIHSKCFINFAHICEMERCPYCRNTNIFPSKFDAYELACFLDMDAVIEYYIIAKNFPLTSKEQILETNALLCSYVKIFSWPRFAFHWRAIRWMEEGKNYKHLSKIFEEYENQQKSSKMKSQLVNNEKLAQNISSTNRTTVLDDNSSNITYLVKIGKYFDEDTTELAGMSYLLLRQSKFCSFITKNVKNLWRLLEIKEGEFHNLQDSYSNLKIRLTVLITLNQCEKHQLKPEEWNLLHIQVCHLELVINGYTNMLKYMKKFELPMTILHSHEILWKLYQTGYTAEFFKILRTEQVEIRSYKIFKFIYGAGDCKVCIEKYASALRILKNRPDYTKDLVKSISEPYKFNKLYHVAMQIVERRSALWKECMAKVLECHSFTDKQIAAIFLEKRKEEEFLEVVKAEQYYEVEYFLFGNINPIALAAGISLHLKDNTPEAKNSMRKCIDRLRKDDADLLAVPIYFMKQANNLAYKGLVQLLAKNHFLRLIIEVEIDSDLDESGIACLNYELIKNPQKMKIYADQFQKKYVEMLKSAENRENDDDSWIETMLANFPKGADWMWMAEVPNEKNSKAYTEIDAFKSPYFRKENAVTFRILDMVKKESVKNLDDANFEDNIGWALALEHVESNSEMHEYVLDQLLFSKHLIMAFRVCWDNPSMLSEIVVKKLPERFQRLHAALKLFKENEATGTD